MRHFRLSFAVTVVLMALAGWWGYEHGGVPGMLSALWITAVLGVLEVSLSFDNAVVNASVLRHWYASSVPVSVRSPPVPLPSPPCGTPSWPSAWSSGSGPSCSGMPCCPGRCAPPCASGAATAR